MVERPRVQYAVSDGLSIAYTRFGHGDEVAVYLPAWVSNVELIWDLAEFSRAYERAGNHHQVITIDKRGVGLSDRTNEPPTLPLAESGSICVSRIVADLLLGENYSFTSNGPQSLKGIEQPVEVLTLRTP